MLHTMQIVNRLFFLSFFPVGNKFSLSFEIIGWRIYHSKIMTTKMLAWLTAPATKKFDIFVASSFSPNALALQIRFHAEGEEGDPPWIKWCMIPCSAASLAEQSEDATINMQNWVENTQNSCEKCEQKNFNTLTSFLAFAEKEILNKWDRKK